MKRRIAVVFALNVLLLSTGGLTLASADEQPNWRSVGIDPTQWTDTPDEEDTPMKITYQGNAVLEIRVSYYTSLTSQEFQGAITIELFEQWTPITTKNIIEHIEMGLYDGVFFHRVVDDFVIQSGDPECKTMGAYPVTSAQCSNGGTGETIILEHDVNLSHVDGAMGMARGAEENSADSQWYITDNEQHGLDPENREDGGYAVFGIVRDGMSHVREIANTPTVTNPGSDQGVQNPGPDLLGRPIREVHIDSVEMIGVSDPDGTIRFGVMSEESEPLITGTILGISAMIFVAVSMLFIARIDSPLLLESEASSVTVDAVLLED